MRTKLATVALATLLTVGSTAVALAQAADTITAHREMAEARPFSYSATQNHSFASAKQNDATAASSGDSVHQRPQG